MKLKTCKSCGFPKIWSKSLCKTCFLKLHPSKSLKGGSKIAKYSEKGLLKKEAKKALLQEDFALYREIWAEREHKCFETGIYLGEELLITMMHHCLYKSVYPQYRHEKWNIVVISPSIHELTHLNIDKTPKIKEYTQKLKKLYG